MFGQSDRGSDLESMQGIEHDSQLMKFDNHVFSAQREYTNDY